MPAWPADDEDPVGTATALEAASQALGDLIKQAKASGVMDRKAAIRTILYQQSHFRTTDDDVTGE